MARVLSARDDLILDVAVIAGAFATIPLMVVAEHVAANAWIQTAEWAIWSVFLADFLVRTFWVETDYRQKLLMAAVVVLSFPLLPVTLGLVRVVRLSRLLRLARLAGVTVWGMEGLRAVLGRQSVVYVGSASVLIVLAGGGALTILEPQTVHGGFQDGVWWAIVMATTIGWDVAPTTFWGRAIAVFLILTGLGLVSTLAASITAYFLGQQDNEVMAEVKSQLARMEAVLNRMQEERAQESMEAKETKASRAASA